MKFSLPGFHEFEKLNLWIIDRYNYDRNIFFDSVIIDNIYGSVPNVVWNGGRNGPLYRLELDNIRKLFVKYKKRGVRLRITFTNCMLEEEHLCDKYANDILQLVDEMGFEITLSSDLLESYIRNKYPSIPIISSTTKCILDIDELNREISKDYKLVVLDYRKNADELFLKKIKNPGKIELLLNEDCFSTCVQRMRHYRDISLNIIMEDKLPDTEIYCQGKYRNLYDSMDQKETIKNIDLYTYYSYLGVENAKIRGRRSDFYDVLESYMYYLIKDEYRDRIRLEVLQDGVWENY